MKGAPEVTSPPERREPGDEPMAAEPANVSRSKVMDGEPGGLPLAPIYYVLTCLLSALMLMAMLVPEWLFGGVFEPNFDGLASYSRPIRQVLGETLVWAWVGVGIGVLALALVALLLVRSAARRAQGPILVTPLAALSWRRVYSLRLWLADLMVVVWAVWGAQMIWFGGPGDPSTGLGRSGVVSYRWVSLLIVIGWMLALSLAGARDPLIYGEGTAEYGRVLTASFFWAGLVAIAALMLKLDVARGYLLLAFPLGLFGLLSSRKLWRSWLVIKRARQGLYTQRAVVVASSGEGAARLFAELDRSPVSGYTVLAIAFTEDAEPPEAIRALGLPIISADAAVDVMRDLMGDSLIVADSPLMGAEAVRKLAWALDPRTEHLIVAPQLLDVAGPRVSMRPVAGLSLLHVDLPTFSGGRALAKRSIDLAVAALGLLVLAVPFGVLAILVRVTSRGPAFYRQSRVGLHGDDFVMWKFRSMVAGADQQLDHLEDQRSAGNEVLFKIKDDPRVTAIGRWMRRWSVDEFPQLINVLTGSMSLVGPRPPLRAEVQQYTKEQMDRRFLVKPGITGLWQVSGRSDLSWEESIRLDLYYVENWSILVDLQLLLRTARAVLRNEGAY
ncbi:MAG: sugar transferase [Bifidobacteriaceae bacterium]|nr:sugar transferase [Bifidobacteriaceae bacterium]